MRSTLLTRLLVSRVKLAITATCAVGHLKMFNCRIPSQHLWRALTQVPGCQHNMIQTDTAGAEEKADTVAPLSVTQPLQSLL